MSIYPLPTAGQDPAPEQMRTEIEIMLRSIQQTSVQLLSQLDDADDIAGETLRSEISRLNGLGFTIVRCLAHDNLPVAYRLVTGEADETGDTLGLVA